ncbi:hypothetical protein B0H12DRAFT_1070016 [Mycena haematopus]|nr:hypothetical protein B0H12DRAFT_1070016 [Mycena haematopus]
MSLPAGPPPTEETDYLSCSLPFFPGHGFKNHDYHSAHAARYYYLIKSGAYSTLQDCVNARTDGTHIVRVAKAELAGQEWWKMCRASHPQCQERNASAPSVSGPMEGITSIPQLPLASRRIVVARPSSTTSSPSVASRTAESSSSGGSSGSGSGGSGGSSSSSNLSIPEPSTSSTFFFVIPTISTIFFDAESACAESRRSGAKLVRVVKSFEAAMESITSHLQSAGNSDLGASDDAGSSSVSQ